MRATGKPIETDRHKYFQFSAIWEKHTNLS